MQIKGYEIKGELKTNNSGFSKWGFATKNGRDYFIKEFIDPVYPIHTELLDQARSITKEKYVKIMKTAVGACITLSTTVPMVTW